MAMSITGSGKSIRSRTMGSSASQSVSPVVANLRPTTAQMSPARTSGISSFLSARICTSRLARSRLPFTEFHAVVPACRRPE